MNKINIGTNGFPYPMPVCLVGAAVNGVPNFMAVGWFARINFKPPIITIAISRARHTFKGIKDNETFSVNIPGTDLMAETDYCGIVSGKTHSKSEMFDVFYGELETAPMIAQCPLCMECRLIDSVNLPTHTLYIGEIIGTYTEEKFLTNGVPDIEKIKPFLLTMPDNNYWAVGEHLGKAWSIGSSLKKDGRQ